MKILHVHKGYHTRDGSSRYMRELMMLQEHQGHVVAPFVMRDEKNEPTPWSAYFTEPLVKDPVTQLRNAFWNPRAHADLAHMLDAFLPDVAHIHNIYTHLSPSVLFALKGAHIPIVMTVHDYALVSGNYALWDEARARPLPQSAGVLETARTRFVQRSFIKTAALDAVFRSHRFLRWYDRLVDSFLCYSEFSRRVLIDAGFSADKIHVVGAFASPFLLDQLHSHPNLLHAQKETDVLFLGRYETYKGMGLALELAHKMPDVQFSFAGGGSAEHMLQTATQTHKNIRNIGFLSGDNLWRAVLGAKCVFVPSLWPEPFGLVALEAMALGVPVVASNRGGLPEIVEDGVSGLIFDPDIPSSAHNALQKVLHDEAYRARLAQAAVHRAYTLGNPQRHLSTIIDHYRAVSSIVCI